MRKIKLFIIKIYKNTADFITKYIHVFLALFLIYISIFVLHRVYEEVFGFHVVAKFKELGSLSRNMPVYFRGYKVGKTKKVTPTDNYQYTLVKMRIFPRDLNLPANTIAKAQTFDSGKDYIELVYPSSPSIDIVKNNDEIKGKTTLDIKSFMSKQIDSGVLGAITDNASSTLSSVEKTSNEIRELIADFREILKENRENIKLTTDNIVMTSENLGYMSESFSLMAAHLEESMDKEKIASAVENIDESFENVKKATKNLESMTQNLDLATKNLDKTIAKVDSTVEEVNETACHAKNITAGFRELLSQRFAGIKLFFGKPIKNNSNDCKICKQNER